MNRKLKILMFSPGPLAAAGPGAGTRSYHFARALAHFSELTLLQLSPGPNRQLPADLSGHCFLIVQPNSGSASVSRQGRGRFRSWLGAMRVLVFPWLGQWTGLMTYAFDFWPGGINQASPPPPSPKWSRRLLSAAVRLELSLAARFFQPMSAIAFCHWADFCSLRSQVHKLLDEVEFDVLWFEHAPNYSFVRELLRGRKRPRLVCNTHNIEFHLCDQCERLAPTRAAKQWCRVQAGTMKKVERAAFAACDLVVACSEADKKMALDLVPSANVCVAANGVDTAYFRPSAPRVPAPEPRLLMTGSFAYGPNVDGVHYFIREIFPRIKQRQPDCRFVMAGLKAGVAFQQLGISDPSVIAVSDPPDIRPEFDGATVFVVPLRAGGGTRLKILEAMAMEVPVVSTRLGAEGVPYRDGEHLLLAETPEAFADAVLRLLADSALRQRLQTQAAAWARRNYDWSRLCSQAIESLHHLCL
jgi:polysaccharide biosynthesis protein PslH